ncbi:MAG TPA: hypothetical protein VED40_09295 [Azospirillaceae bacterium]|nr:hypothetical protein [Azospirillaceae bacterium]
MTKRVHAQIQDLQELLRQLRTGPSDAPTLMSIERLESSIALFQSMLDDQAKPSDQS